MRHSIGCQYCGGSGIYNLNADGPGSPEEPDCPRCDGSGLVWCTDSCCYLGEPDPREYCPNTEYDKGD